jgi:lysophospholipase L1-like esterase
MKKNVLFALTTVVVSLLLSDLVLRLVMAPPPSRPFAWPPPDMTKHGLMPDKARFWKLRPGYNEPWRLYKLAYTSELASRRTIDFEIRKKVVAPLYQGVTWEVNEDGFRGNLVPGQKPPGKKRLLFLGSSVTFGWGVPADKVFPELVRKGLEASFSGVAFESLNAGVPGYSSFQGLQYLKWIFPRYEPDVVVAEFGINDGTMAVGKADKAWQPGPWDAIRPAIRNSGWGRLMLKVFGSFIKGPDVVNRRQTRRQAQQNFYRMSVTGTMTRVVPEDFRANLDKMAALCREQGALFFVLIPNIFNEYGNKELLPVVNILTPHAIPVFDVLSALSPQELESMFLPYDEGHLSRAGHRLVADYIVDFLKPRIAGKL